MLRKIIKEQFTWSFKGSIYNPLSGIIGSSFSRHAHTINSDFKTKISDTFNVLAGEWPYHNLASFWFDRRWSYGILDQTRIDPFLFFLARVSQEVFNELLTLKPWQILLLVFPLPILPALFATTLALGASLAVNRTTTATLAAVLTAVSMIAILPFMQIASWLMKSYYTKKAEKLTLESDKEYGEIVKLKLNDPSLQKSDAYAVTERHCSTQLIVRSFDGKRAYGKSISLDRVMTAKDKTEDEEAMHALVKLNYDGLAAKANNECLRRYKH